MVQIMSVVSTPFEKYARELGSFPPFSGMNIKNIFETTQPNHVFFSFLWPPDYGSLWPDISNRAMHPKKRHVHSPHSKSWLENKKLPKSTCYASLCVYIYIYLCIYKYINAYKYIYTFEHVYMKIFGESEAGSNNFIPQMFGPEV